MAEDPTAVAFGGSSPDTGRFTLGQRMVQALASYLASRADSERARLLGRFGVIRVED